MAAQRSRSGSASPRRPRKAAPAKAKKDAEAAPVIEEIERPNDPDAFDFGDEDQVEETRSTKRRGSERQSGQSEGRRGSERQTEDRRGSERETEERGGDKSRGGDDFGADIVPDESVAPAASEGKEASTDRGEAGTQTERDDNTQRRGRRRRRRGRRDDTGGSYGNNGPAGGGGGSYSGGGGGRYQQHGQRGGRHDRGGGGGRHGGQQQQQRRGRYQKAAVGESHEPPVMSGMFEGVLELHPKQYGFLRTAANDYGALDTDPFVSSSLVEKYGLREGIKIRGEVGPGVRGQGPRLLEIETIDGGNPEEFSSIKHFDHLTPINPFEQIRLETGPTPITMRVMDLLTPIGKGQRALIVAPPRSGKTMLMQDIANAVSQNHPEIHIIVLLIDERPEEVTEMRRMVNGEVIASSMDRDVESHVRISQLVIERGKRIAESGKDCFILLDSITRTARAFNKWVGGGRDAKIQTGGLDVRALEIPRKMFGTARRFDEGGSLTVCATALIDTGSRMDDAIFQEFKGTGNMELILSRDLADRRIWPSIDITRSGTRREEKLLAPDKLEGITMLRRALVSMNPVDAMVELTKKLVSFPSNKEFLERVRQVL